MLQEVDSILESKFTLVRSGHWVLLFTSYKTSCVRHHGSLDVVIKCNFVLMLFSLNSTAVQRIVQFLSLNRQDFLLIILMSGQTC